jgi:hypothetical protein
LPASPDDVEPGAGEDADGVGVVVAAVACSLVEVGGPGVGVVGVAGEVDDGAAESFADGPAVGDDLRLAGLAGGRCSAGEGGQYLWGGVSAAGVADLGEQPGRAHGARAGQRGEDRGIGVDGELLGDLFVERGDLGPDAGERGDQGEGDLGAAGGLGSGGPVGRVVQVIPESAEVGQVVVADTAQPVAQPDR